MEYACGSLSQFVSDAPRAMAMFDREMRYLAASPRWLAFMGLEQTPVGRSHYEDLPDGGAAWRASHQRCLAGAAETSAGERFPRPDGSARWVSYEVCPWRDGNGAIGGLVITGEDITERIEAQRRAEEAERRLEGAIDAIPGGFAIYDPDDRLVVANRAARAMYPDADDETRPGATFERLLRINFDRGDYGYDKADREDWIRERIERHRNPSGAIEQATHAGRWLRIEERRTPDGGTVVLRTDITDLKTRERELAQKTALLEATFRDIGEGILVYDDDGRLVTGNGVAARLLGAPGDLFEPGASIEALVRYRAGRGDYGEEDTDAAVQRRMALFRARTPWRGAWRQPDGRTIESWVNAMPDGGMIFVLRDITERADYEERLAEKTAFLETTLQNMGEAIAVFGPDLTLRMWNDLAVRLLEMPDTLAQLGTSFEEVVRIRAAHGDFGKVEVDARVRDAVALFRGRRGWSRIDRQADGRVLEARFQPLPDGGAVYVLRDVSERAQAEARLGEKTALLEATLHNMGEGLVAFDADRKLLLINEFAARLVDFPPGLIRPGLSYDELLRFLATTDDAGSRDVESFVDSRVALFCARKPFVVTRLLKDGRVIETRFNPTPDGGGLFIYRDVTERAAFEARLAEKTALLEAALENMGEGFSVYGPDLRLVIRSKVSVEILDLPLAPLQPETPFEEVMRFRAERGDFGEGDVESQVASRVARFRAQKPWSETRRDRHGRAIELRFNPTPDSGGVFMFRDVSERVDAEEKLAERTALLETTLENTGDGIAVFGPGLELLTCNRVIANMLHLPAEVSSGVSFEQIIRLRAVRGDFGDVDPDVSVRERVARFRAQSRWSDRVVLAGRVVDVHFNPMPDGGGVYVMRDVTERADAEAKLAERTALLEATLENMGEGIAVYGPDLRLRTYNEVAMKMFGAPAALVQPGTSFAEIVRFQASRGGYGDGDADSAVRDRIAQFRAQKPWSATHMIRGARAFDTRFSPMPDGGGIFLFRDVTERVEQEAKLAEKTALLEAVLENIGEGIAVYGPDLRLRMCNEVMSEVIGAPPGLLTPGVSREDVVRFRAARGDFGDLDVEEAVRERVARFRAQEPLTVTRTMHDGRKVEAHFRPMPDAGGLFVLHDVTERDRNETRIREEEAKFRSLVEQDVAGIVIVRDDGTIGYCNGCFADMIGYARDELAGRPLMDFVPEREQPVVARHLREQLFDTGAAAQIASTVRARNGSVIEVLVNASRAIVEGHPASIAVVVDVTARNRAQRELASAAAILAAVHESSPDGILVVDPAARILSANKRFGEIMGVPAEVLAAGDDMPVLAIVSQRMLDGEAFLRGVQYYYEHPEEPVHDELQLNDGRVLDRISSQLRTADGENLGRIWFFRDISERRRAEASLRASEERFRMLIEEAPDAILLLDFDQNRFVAANKAAERLFGVVRDRILEEGARRFYTPNQPDGRPVPESIVDHDQRALAGEEVKFERRIRRPSGEERLTRVTLVRLASSARLLRASFVDVTDQVAAEAKLSEVLRNLVDRQEEERQRIARELHDSLGQYLAAVNIKLETFNQSLSDASPLKSGVADLKTLTGTIGNEVNRLAWEMRPTTLDDIGLGPAIRQFLDEWAERSGMRFDVHLALKDRRMPANVETTLYRVLQEGITNIVKHARAGRVGVIVKASGSDVIMIIEDDGVGFDLETLSRASPRLGLLGMRERLAAIHGGLEIETRPGEGTTLITRVIIDGSADSRH